jgi:hypothetical protein
MQVYFGGQRYGGWDHVYPRMLHRHLKLRRREAANVQFMLDNWEEYCFFAVTRNPFDVVATYYVDNKFNENAPKDAMLEAAKRAVDLADYIRRVNEVKARHISEDDHMSRLRDVHRIVRYEDGIPGAFVPIMREHGIEVTRRHLGMFPRQGVTHGKEHWSTYYNDESRAMVEELYGGYLEKCGYSFDDGVSISS